MMSTNPEEQPRYDDLSSVFVEDVLESFRPDEIGDFRLTQEETELFERALANTGILADKPSEETVRAAAEQARRAIEDGSAEQFLGSASFISDYQYQKLLEGTQRSLLIFAKPVYINPEAVAGAMAFDSWKGRGAYGHERKQEESTGIKRTSLQTIFDYASRDTPLPELDITREMDAIITPEHKLVLYSSAAHRTAAAKLRNEPLGLKGLRVHAPIQQ